MSPINFIARRKKRKAIEQQVVATSQDADGSQETIEDTVVEVAAPGVKKPRAKKVVVERGDALRPSYAIQTSQGVQGKWSGDCLIAAISPTWPFTKPQTHSCGLQCCTQQT